MSKIFVLITFLVLPFSSGALELGGIKMPEQLQAGETSLNLNGAGIRSKFVFDLYVAGLYLKSDSSDAAAIIQSAAPMAIRLHIISPKITSEKMSKATKKGFESSTKKNTAPIAAEIEQFISAFNEPIKEGDVFEFVYTQGKGVAVTKNDVQKLIVPSAQFKAALFGIWLSDKPAQKSLKKAMLGK